MVTLPTVACVDVHADLTRCGGYRNRIEVGDVIVAHSPTDHTQTICKRVLAMEGDQILLHAYGQPVTIPKGHVWLAGDNTANSTDSRTYGPVPQALIKGRVFYKIWPPQCVGPIPNTLKVWEKPPGEVSRFDLRHRIRRRYTPAASEEPGPSSPPEEVDEETEQSAGRLGSGETAIEPNPAMDPAPRSAGQDASAVQTVQAEGGSGGFSEGISEGDGWTNGDPQRVAAGGENRLT